MAALSRLNVVAMMSVTCLDTVLRLFGHPPIGASDIVRLLSVITISCAFPYTTAVKGHVAIEFFFHKMNRAGRMIVDTGTRIISLTLFGLLSWRCVEYGKALKRTGEVTMTLQIPMFGVMYVIAFSCVVVALVILEHLLKPGKAFIEP